MDVGFLPVKYEYNGTEYTTQTVSFYYSIGPNWTSNNYSFYSYLGIGYLFPDEIICDPEDDLQLGFFSGKLIVGIEKNMNSLIVLSIEGGIILIEDIGVVPTINVGFGFDLD